MGFLNLTPSASACTGPQDARQPRLVTHPLVHIATHAAAFPSVGALYPATLPAAEAKAWISAVYGYKNTLLPKGVHVHNTARFRGRAPACAAPAGVGAFEMAAGRDALREYVVRRLNLTEACVGAYCPGAGREVISMLE